MPNTVYVCFLFFVFLGGGGGGGVEETWGHGTFFGINLPYCTHWFNLNIKCLSHLTPVCFISINCLKVVLVPPM